MSVRFSASCDHMGFERLSGIRITRDTSDQSAMLNDICPRKPGITVPPGTRRVVSSLASPRLGVLICMSLIRHAVLFWRAPEHTRPHILEPIRCRVLSLRKAARIAGYATALVAFCDLPVVCKISLCHLTMHSQNSSQTLPVLGERSQHIVFASSQDPLRV
jgi:hypothetical protein